ncbi:hypothetical protein TRFO_30617 [Tritrichomonas foetus]|uniref:Uncharacterized protein n=1 Tax=Tritrichomonas foetus TaxID=1144522 RepID=A0A1J4JXP0_9EUKA|nr:hypothetical protein TRFO_30617 [Tritrichomonas foetus]|eukprot:OHT02294.1 hypothetical protein TRFO_30617 [Tritrichomonas foetus]
MFFLIFYFVRISIFLLSLMSIESSIEKIIETNKKKYRLTAHCNQSESISIQIVTEDFTQRYACEISAAYVEEITVRSGGLKRLPVFWKMFFLGSNKSSKNLKIEIFSAYELQQLSTTLSDNMDKIYVILTQISDFDIIRYPLPVPMVPFTNDELIMTVKKLYKENNKLNDMIAEMSVTHSVQTLEQKISILSADYEDLQAQKNSEIEKLRKKLKLLKEKKAQENSAGKLAGKRSPQMWDRLNQKGSPRKLFKEQPKKSTPKSGQDLRRPKTPK